MIRKLFCSFVINKMFFNLQNLQRSYKDDRRKKDLDFHLSFKFLPDPSDLVNHLVSKPAAHSILDKMINEAKTITHNPVKFTIKLLIFNYCKLNIFRRMQINFIVNYH